jgi:hypothetical protein
MSVATFSPPIAATKKSDGSPVVVIGVHEYRKPNWDNSAVSHEVSFMEIDQNGEIEWLESHEFSMDFRWHPVTGWGDPNAQPGQDDDGDA